MSHPQTDLWTIDRKFLKCFSGIQSVLETFSYHPKNFSKHDGKSFSKAHNKSAKEQFFYATIAD